MHEWLESNSDCKGLEYLYTLILIIPPDLLFRIMINYHVLRDKQTLYWVIKQLAYKFSLYFSLYHYHSLIFHLQKNRRERKYQIILWIYWRRIYSIENWHEYLPLSVSVARFHLDRFDWYSKATGAEFLGFRSASFRAANLTLATFRPICHEWKSSCSQQFARTE